jgi:hypothetical protein
MFSDDQDDSTYYLMYPEADMGKLKVLKLYASDSHKIHQYDIASRQSWSNPIEATAYGIQLAKEKDKIFEHDRSIDPESYRESLLLD